MKKITALLLVLIMCVMFCSCAPLSKSGTISYNDDFTQLYYNGATYVSYKNTTGKYRFEPEQDAEYWVKIATMPYGFFYILGAVTEYYGNDVDNPDYITNDRSRSFYVREDLTIDHRSALSVCDTDAPFRFCLADVTTGNVIPFDMDKKVELHEICNFFAAFEDYPGVRLWITVYEQNGRFYLQDVHDSDFYEITDAFKDDLYQAGISDFTYR